MAFQIGENCQIHPTAVINVRSGYLGAGSIVNEGARIEGALVEIGREAFIDRFATIGGGSCFDPQAFLKAGDWFHMGYGSQINTARGVTVGHELGCGIETKIFTHGAYIDSYLLGAPVQWEAVHIGDSVWLPNAWINPGVTIGSNVIVAARSLVNKNIPSGALAGGVPCKVIKENYLPQTKSLEDRTVLISGIFEQALRRSTKPTDAKIELEIENDRVVTVEGQMRCNFDLKGRLIAGHVTELNLLFKDQLRRNGIRFRVGVKDGQWQSWGSDPRTLF